MEDGRWVPLSERLPTVVDADPQQCVLVWHELSGCLIYHIERVQQNQFITHWMRLPGRPVSASGGGRYGEHGRAAEGDQSKMP